MICGCYYGNDITKRHLELKRTRWRRQQYNYQHSYRRNHHNYWVLAMPGHCSVANYRATSGMECSFLPFTRDESSDKTMRQWLTSAVKWNRTLGQQFNRLHFVPKAFYCRCFVTEAMERDSFPGVSTCFKRKHSSSLIPATEYSMQSSIIFKGVKIM